MTSRRPTFPGLLHVGRSEATKEAFPFPFLCTKGGDTMRAKRPATKKGAIATLAMMLAIPAILLIDPGPVSVVDRAFGKKIIIMCEGIEPLGTLHENGRRVDVVLSDLIVDYVPGFTTEADVVVEQFSTGAVAHGHVRHVPIEEGSVGPNHTHVVKAHCFAGSPPFEEGIVLVTYFRENRIRGNVVNTWTMSLEVLLLSEE
jgi:hypothetical protein